VPHQRSAPPSRRLLLGVTPFPALSPTEIDAHARKIEFVHRTGSPAWGADRPLMMSVAKLPFDRASLH